MAEEEIIRYREREVHVGEGAQKEKPREDLNRLSTAPKLRARERYRNLMNL